MIDKTLKRDIESAGSWFVGEYLSIVMENYFQLQNNKEYKNHFIKQLHMRKDKDKNINGTRTRLNALIRIIKRNKAKEALVYIIKSERINKNNPESIKIAIETLRKITE